MPSANTGSRKIKGIKLYKDHVTLSFFKGEFKIEHYSVFTVAQMGSQQILFGIRALLVNVTGRSCFKRKKFLHHLDLGSAKILTEKRHKALVKVVGLGCSG